MLKTKHCCTGVILLPMAPVITAPYAIANRRPIQPAKYLLLMLLIITSNGINYMLLIKQARRNTSLNSRGLIRVRSHS